MTTETNQPLPVQPASVKLPPFWAENARLWFAQAESQFALKNITASATKYHHVVATLPLEVASRVLHLVEETPAEQPYEELKSGLLETYTLTEYQRAEALLHLPPLGSSPPGELLSQIKALLPNNHGKNCFLVRHAFLSRIPENIRTLLLARTTDTLDELSALAETMMSASAPSSAPSFAVSEQQGSIDAISQQQGNRSSRRQRTSAPPPRRRTTDDQRSPPLCWYHRTFGDQATKCRSTAESPCSASGNGSSGGRL